MGKKIYKKGSMIKMKNKKQNNHPTLENSLLDIRKEKWYNKLHNFFKRIIYKFKL